MANFASALLPEVNSSLPSNPKGGPCARHSNGAGRGRPKNGPVKAATIYDVARTRRGLASDRQPLPRRIRRHPTRDHGRELRSALPSSTTARTPLRGCCKRSGTTASVSSPIASISRARPDHRRSHGAQPATRGYLLDVVITRGLDLEAIESALLLVNDHQVAGILATRADRRHHELPPATRIGRAPCRRRRASRSSPPARR